MGTSEQGEHDLEKQVGSRHTRERCRDNFMSIYCQLGFPGGSEVKNLPVSAGDVGLIPGSGRSPGEGNGNLLQYSCLENPMDKEPGGLQSTESQRVGHNLGAIKYTS